MTTIAFKDGVLAADSQVSSHGGTRLGVRTKLRRIGSSLFGFAGDVSVVERAAYYFEAIAMPRSWFGSRFGHVPARPDLGGGALNMLEVSEDGVSLYGSDLVPEPLRAPFYALGSGRDFALGAMAMGATAIQAVEVAIQFDVYSGGPIQALSLSPCEPESGVRE